MTYLLLRRKYDVMAEHERRLRQRPDPAGALKRFYVRIQWAERIHWLRTACDLGLSFSFVAAASLFALQAVDGAGPLKAYVNLIGSFASSLGVLLFVGALACSRYLERIDMELSFCAAEGRMRAVRARGP